MKSTIVFYESYYGTAKKSAEVISLINGNSKVFDINNVTADIKYYDNFIFVFAFHGYNTAQKTIKYVKQNAEVLNGKKIVLCGVGLESRNMESYVNPIIKAMKRNADYTYFIEGQLRVNKLNENDKQILKEFLESHNMKLMDMGKFKIRNVCSVSESISQNINKPQKELNKVELLKCIETFFKSHNTCALATGSDDFIRITPIEYMYINNALYFITEGGLKFKGILLNSNVSCAVFDNYTGMQNLKGMQIYGQAEIIEIGSREYLEIIKHKKITMEQLNRLPVNLNMIKLNIRKVEFLNSDFKKLNYDVKQVLVLK